MGKFADGTDVTNRYEGEIPSERLAWVNTRVDDVEAVLMGLVPSLTVPLDQIDEGRAARVKALVCDKVLDLYRNPGRVNSQSTTSGPYSETTTFLSGLARAGVGGISFSDDELRMVRLRGKRSNLGVAHIKPFIPGQVC